MIAFQSREKEPPWIILEGIEKLKLFPNIAFSAEINGQIQGCGGMVVYARDQAYPWIMISDEMAKYPLWLHRVVKRYYKQCIELFHVERMFSEVAICSERNTLWLQSFGFKPKREQFNVNGREYQRHECEVG